MLDKLRQRMQEVAHKAGDLALDVIGDKVHPDVQKQRMDTCLSCEKLYQPTNTCKICGCLMNVKTWLPRQECPVKKWLASEPYNPETNRK